MSPPDVEPIATRVVPADERIPYDLAAKALNVSRRTVERMVSDGRLDRDASATDAATVARVTRRSLVAALGDRREQIATPTPSVGTVTGPDLSGLVADLVEARETAARLEERCRLLEAGADESGRRDELLGALVAGSWRDRRRARRDAMAALVAPGPTSTST